MKRYSKPILALVVVLAAAFHSPAQNNACPSPIRFRITLSKELAVSASGRLLVFMSSSTEKRDTLQVDFLPGSTMIAGMDVESITSARFVELDPGRTAFPQPFSQAKAGTYQVMALLDPNHSYPYHGQDEGDLTSQVVTLENLNPADTKPIELTLSRLTPARMKLADTESIKLVEFQSPMLSTFWGRAIKMRAGVVLPPSYDKEPTRTYPTVYHIHGFGGDHTGAWRGGPLLVKAMTEGKQPEMIHVSLDGSFSTGHHEFADSVNNGPWGRALTEEFIPYLEKKFRMVATPGARFLTGHSSGGWSTLWLQVTYPDFFGGTWSTAPDPVDFREFTGINATPGSKDNAYRRSDGTAKNLVRMNGKDVLTLEEFARMELVLGSVGGQLASFEWVFSPRGPDGRPLKLFNRETGELNEEVMRAWEKYDIRLILERNWSTLAPKLRGKINVICGGADTFHLNEPFALLCDFFKQKGSDAVCELVPGRDHMNLYESYQTYPNGLGDRIYKEMYAKFKK